MNQLEEHFTYPKLLKYTFPSILMMIFTSVYGAVDGLFLSNFAGKTSFAAVNFILPFLLVLGNIGFMFGSGGSALIAKTLGEGKRDEANRIFSFLVLISVLSGAALSAVGFWILRPLAQWLGADGPLLEDCLIYGRIYLWGIPATVVQYEFQNLFVTADKPVLGLYASVGSGVCNMLLDALFVAGFSWGLQGAAFATILSQWLGCLIPLVYFSKKNKSLLHFVRIRPEWRAFGSICFNGFSEWLNCISMSVVSMVYNAQLLHYAGNNGLAAYGVLMYINFLFISIFIGYTVGISPVISFHYGAKNKKEIRSLLFKSYVVIGAASVLMFALSEAAGASIARIFVGYDAELFMITQRGFFLYSFAFLFTGFAIFGSSFFTALNNGRISALISFMRTMVFELLLVLLLPLYLETDGIWLSVVIAECLAALLGICWIICRRREYTD